MEGGKKVCVVLWLTRTDREFVEEKKNWGGGGGGGHSIARATSYCLFPETL